MTGRHRVSQVAGISFSWESRDTRWRTGAKLHVACSFLLCHGNETTKFTGANRVIAPFIGAVENIERCQAVLIDA